MFQFRCIGCGFVMSNGLPSIEALSSEQSLAVETFNADKHWAFFGSIYEGHSEANLCSFCLMAFIENEQMFAPSVWGQTHEMVFPRRIDEAAHDLSVVCKTCGYVCSWSRNLYVDYVYASRQMTIHKLQAAGRSVAGLSSTVTEGITMAVVGCAVSECFNTRMTVDADAVWYCGQHQIVIPRTRMVKLIAIIDHSFDCDCADCEWIADDNNELNYELVQETTCTHDQIIWPKCPNGCESSSRTRAVVRDDELVEVDLCYRCGAEMSELSYVDLREGDEW